ncbi:hypothetical protein N0V93_000586 [Gnomoniopsis smithogilvyi]|uniref:Uncharacterized protein n=1 Tax=Gnomoniopsis smithogilvyi TaxID=1191159 RepID=A0A9W8Z032_9PEZI|nr:hypothetical protein N0V93_000586 [Gnomoniopsis smithogilvyi]
MSIAHSETSTSSSARARVRDTGFPEGFCGNRNTSLPHPDADTSPNASITQEDISVSRVMSRHRRSFLAKSKRTISHGLITPEMEQMYSDIAVTSDSDASPVLTQDARLPDNPTRPLSGGANSFNSASTGDREDAAPKSPHRHSRQRSSISSTGRGHRRSFMERLGLHKHHE